MRLAISAAAIAIAALSAGSAPAADSPGRTPADATNSASQLTTTDAAKSDSQPAQPQTTWYQDLYAPELIGKDVVDASGDEIAEVENIVAKSDGGKLFAVVSTGGWFFGLNGREVAVPLIELGLDTGKDDVVALALSEQHLKDMPAYDPTQYQSVNQYAKLGNVAAQK